MDTFLALTLAADPNKGTIVTINAAKEALKNFWWIEYYQLENLKPGADDVECEP